MRLGRTEAPFLATYGPTRGDASPGESDQQGDQDGQVRVRPAALASTEAEGVEEETVPVEPLGERNHQARFATDPTRPRPWINIAHNAADTLVDDIGSGGSLRPKPPVDVVTSRPCDAQPAIRSTEAIK